MRNITIYESYPPLKEDDIVAAERQLGISLPADYRNFLLKHNGGYPEPDAFPISGFRTDGGGRLSGGEVTP